MTELKPCDCGSQVSVQPFQTLLCNVQTTLYAVTCKKCGKATEKHSSEEIAITRWNNKEKKKERDNGGWWYVDNEGDGYGW